MRWQGRGQELSQKPYPILSMPAPSIKTVLTPNGALLVVVLAKPGLDVRLDILSGSSKSLRPHELIRLELVHVTGG